MITMLNKLLKVGCLLLFPCLVTAQNVHWQLKEDAGRYEVLINGEQPTPAFRTDSLHVFVGAHTSWPGKRMSAILGQVTSEAGGLCFHPTFSFRPGVTYTAYLGQSDHFEFTIPASGKVPELSNIYPSIPTVPANLLKIYLHFSEPMGEGRAYEHLLLTNTAGDTIRQPFVPLQPELWSADRRRLTLWLDPGRVKRGLLSHEAQGVVLSEGNTYTLTVARDWKDIRGNTLDQSYQKQFRVVAPDYQQPQPDHWSVAAPRAHTRDALRIQFGEAMDHALAQRLIRLINEAGDTVSGTVQVVAGESEWQFVPTHSWQSGSYTLIIDTDLEDLAGNNLNRPFDRDLNRVDNKTQEQDFVQLEIRIPPSN